MKFINFIYACSKIIGRTFSIIASDLGLPLPTPKMVGSVIGLTLPEIYASFEWPIKMSTDESYEKLFISTLEKVTTIISSEPQN